MVKIKIQKNGDNNIRNFVSYFTFSEPARVPVGLSNTRTCASKGLGKNIIYFYEQKCAFSESHKKDVGKPYQT